MKLRSLVFSLAVFGLAVPVKSYTQEADKAFDAVWSATWKIKPGSALLGERLVFALDANGTAHRTTYYSRDAAAKSTSHFDTPCNGTDVVSPEDATFSWSCTKTGDSHFEFTGKRRGALYTELRYEVAADGQTMISTQKSAGQKTATTTHYARFAGKEGLAGEWVARCDACAPSVQVVSIADGAIHIDYRDYQSTVDAKFGGPKVAWTGLNGNGWTIGLTREGPFLIHFVEDSASGEVLLEGSMSLNYAATTLTEVIWFPGQQDTKTTYLYEKQPDEAK